MFDSVFDMEDDAMVFAWCSLKKGHACMVVETVAPDTKESEWHVLGTANAQVVGYFR
jgi:hypothetical protein